MEAPLTGVASWILDSLTGRGHASALLEGPPPAGRGAEIAKRTPTNYYNERPAWLTHAHAAFEAVVAAAYGWPSGLPNEEFFSGW